MFAVLPEGPACSSGEEHLSEQSPHHPAPTPCEPLGSWHQTPIPTPAAAPCLFAASYPFIPRLRGGEEAAQHAGQGEHVTVLTEEEVSITWQQRSWRKKLVGVLLYTTKLIHQQAIKTRQLRPAPSVAAAASHRVCFTYSSKFIWFPISRG